MSFFRKEYFAMNDSPTQVASAPNKAQTLLVAEFDPAVTTYWLAGGAILLLVIVVGIPLLPFWFIFGKIVTGRYLKSHHCELTTRSLKFSKGIFVRQEKTVPLDKITDLGFVQGPLMRMFGVEALSIETAGQSGAGALVQLQGVKEARQFRDRVLAQRDRVTEMSSDGHEVAATTANLGGASEAQTALLTEIRDILSRIEQQSR